MRSKEVVGIVFVLLISLFVLTGCEAYGELNGVVVEKEYTSSYITTTAIYTGKTLMPVTIPHPENWRIRIQKQETRNNKVNLVKCFKRNI